MDYPKELSPHFTWAEAEITNHRRIDNSIPKIAWTYVEVTAERMEHVRALLGNRAILISSWFRCPELNIAVGSKPTSMHLFGTCVDFICPSFGTPKEVVAHLMKYQDTLRYDQLIWERTWIHIGWDPSGKYRSQVLTLNRDGSFSQGLA